MDLRRALILLVGLGMLLGAATGVAQDEGNQTQPGGEPGTEQPAPEAPEGEGEPAAEEPPAQPADGAAPDRIYRTEARDTDCGHAPGEPCWTLQSFEALPGDNVRFVADYTDSDVPHNIHFEAPLDIVTAIETGTMQTVEFEMPDVTQPIRFICDVHPTTMIGFLAPPGALGAAGGGGAGGAHGIVDLGVHYLAYWVGVIAFAVLFIVYGLTFFLFKYGESGATADHMDRPGAPVGSPGESRARAWLLIAVAFIVVVGGIVLAYVSMANVPAAG